MRASMAIWMFGALSACNGLLDLQGGHLADAGMPPDAPPRCPAIGGPPTFSTSLVQVIAQDIHDYSVSHALDLGVGICGAAGERQFICDGKADAPLAEAIGFGAESLVPRLAPDGALGLTVQTSTSSTPYLFSRSGDGTWTGKALTIPLQYGTLVDLTRAFSGSSVTDLAGRRALLISSSGELHEFVADANGTWTQVGAQYAPAADFKVNYFASVRITEDGLRLIMIAQPMNATNGTKTMYADRPSLDARFGAAKLVDTVVEAGTPFLTSNCGRLYFTGLKSVFYVPEIVPAP